VEIAREQTDIRLISVWLRQVSNGLEGLFATAVFLLFSALSASLVMLRCPTDAFNY
jgi:hypothetical protein